MSILPHVCFLTLPFAFSMPPHFQFISSFHPTTPFDLTRLAISLVSSFFHPLPFHVNPVLTIQPFLPFSRYSIPFLSRPLHFQSALLPIPFHSHHISIFFAFPSQLTSFHQVSNLIFLFHHISFPFFTCPSHRCSFPFGPLKNSSRFHFQVPSPSIPPALLWFESETIPF